MPPESSCGRFPANPDRWTSSRSSATVSRRWPPGTPRRRRASSTFSAVVSHGKSAASWKMSVGRPPSISTSPLVGASRPATTLRSVLLPQPEAPTMQTKLPASTVRSRLSSATTASAPRPNTLVTLSSRMAGAVDGECQVRPGGRDDLVGDRLAGDLLDPLVGQGLSLGRIAIDQVVGLDLPGQKGPDDVRMRLEIVGPDDEMGRHVLATGPQRLLVDEDLAAAFLDE